ncbi:MAG: 1-acyl-sn-glycerol-3-phosphate acyltransferase [Bacteroidales bacterium]|nr:1-acyl-sn-glycerol-3-phosphate acyltransferase [Bacteroidales bacterium]
MTTNERSLLAKASLTYRIFMYYVHIFYKYLYFRRTYFINSEKVPDSAPVMIVSNHQNGACDVLSILLFICRKCKTRKIRSVTRGDIYDAHPIGKAIMGWLGILAAYRIDFEGEESLSKNELCINTMEQELMNDGVVILFPEANHQLKRWFGWFSPRYLIVMFEAARKCNFQKEIYLLPSCNHYRTYDEIHGETLIRYGEPIALSLWYEKYQTKPKTVVRELNALVKEQISSMMLNITDLDNYDAIDYLRNTYGVHYAMDNGLNPNRLPDKLTADKQLFAKLEELKTTHEQEIQKIYDYAIRLKTKTKQYRIIDKNADEKYAVWNLLWLGIVGLVLLPLLVASAVLNLLIVGLPKFITSKIDDINTHCTINIPTTVLFTIPLTVIILFVLTWIFTKSLWIFLFCVVALPFSYIFLFRYYHAGERWMSRFRFVFLSKNKKSEWLSFRKQTFDNLDNILKTNNLR